MTREGRYDMDEGDGVCSGWDIGLVLGRAWRESRLRRAKPTKQVVSELGRRRPSGSTRCQLLALLASLTSAGPNCAHLKASP
jgi:hypothetical protein